MKKALILQGYKQGVNDNFYPWLKKELENLEYQVFLPDLQTMLTDSPDLNLMLQQVANLFSVDEETIIFGHGLGGILGMRLAEFYKINKLFLIASWDFNDLTEEHRSFWVRPIDHERIKQNTGKIYCLSSDNDPFVTSFMVEKMSKRLEGEFLLINWAGNFTQEFGITRIPALLDYL